MDINFDELRDWNDSAGRRLRDKADRLQTECEQISQCLRALEVTDELISKIDNLNEELEKMQADNDTLQQQLQEADAKPTEIHNHFETGSSAQVFNDRVTGKFAKIRKWKQREKCKNRKKHEKGKAS